MFLSNVTAVLVLLTGALALPNGYNERYGGAGNDYNKERDYTLSYVVKDDHTYNQQSRHEEKKGKVVTGEYTILEPNGDLRVVKYLADDYGFHADVQNKPRFAPDYSNFVYKPY